MIVYFAGVNTRHFCEAFIGRQVLETFADKGQIRVYGRYRGVFGSIALDCGAYTAYSKGETIDIAEYGDFVAQHGAFYDWCASLDSIDGGADANLLNLRTLEARGLDVMPTFHQGEPWSLLRDYCSEYDRIGLGFSGRPIREPRPFLDEAFSLIRQGTKVHGWAMTNYTADYPFASVDSMTWLHELMDLRGVQTQAGPISHLTDGELIEIIQKRYDRLPRMKKWNARPITKQLGLLKETA